MGVKVVSRYVQEFQKEHNEILPTRGNIHDIGPGITHKGIIVRKKLEKKSTSQIAKETNHSPEAVDMYIRDYGRVKMLIGKRMTVEEISYATGISRGVVEQYKNLHKLENGVNSDKKE
jgi:DNA-binding CsgD family transcriptional regulator